MPKYRQLHTKIIDSDDFNEMPDDFTRLVWVMLPLILDCEGRGLDNMSWIKSHLFPKRVDDIETKQIMAVMDWFAVHKMIIRYAVSGKNYFYIPTWHLYQTGTDREAKSLIPAPTHDQLASNSGVGLHPDAPLDVDVDVVLNLNKEKRPLIFSVYEGEIGALTGMIAQELIEAEKEYPPGWIEQAIHESATNNKRSWKYAHAILKRWKVEGFQSNNKPKPELTPNPIHFDNMRGK